MELSDLVGRKIFAIVPNMGIRHPISSDANGVLFTLDNTTYLVFEDESDGYRSSAGPLLHFEGPAHQLGGGNFSFPEYIREPVLCRHQTKGEYGGEDDVLEVISEATGKIIFRVGTENVDDYYPSFVAEWNPAGLRSNAPEAPHSHGETQ